MKLNDPIPSLEGATCWLGGGPVTAEQLHGRPTLIHIWSSACSECREQFAALRKWEERFGPQGLRIVGVHARSSPEQRDEDAIALVREAGLEHPIAIDAPGAPITQRFHAHFVPSYYLFDAEGRLRHRQAGYDADTGAQAAIERLLASAGSASAPP